VSVPEEVAIIGVDNDQVLCEASQPSLTSVALDTRRIGFEAASLLDRLMKGENLVEHIVVPPLEVVTRGSTDTLAIEDPQVAAALAFIRRNACNGIEAGDVVEQVPLSRRTLERRFREQVGKSILTEIHHLRMSRVTQFLEETDLKLDAIAVRCGFNHTPYMAAQFRKHFDMTPGEFRQRSREREN
jgi:LacI family transcriptional regulator